MRIEKAHRGKKGELASRFGIPTPTTRDATERRREEAIQARAAAAGVPVDEARKVLTPLLDERDAERDEIATLLADARRQTERLRREQAEAERRLHLKLERLGYVLDGTQPVKIGRL